jgi:hypothetical protein
VRPEAIVTHCDQLLQVLSDGRPHDHRQLYALGMIVHSRVADLRKRGHSITHWREDGTSFYKLAGTGSVHDHGDNGETQRSCDTAAPLSDGVPVPAEIVGQLSLEAA